MCACTTHTHLFPQAPREIEETRPAIGWPERGSVEFRDYSTRYRPGLELVLHNLSFTVNPAEKVRRVGLGWVLWVGWVV